MQGKTEFNKKQNKEKQKKPNKQFTPFLIIQQTIKTQTWPTLNCHELPNKI